MAQQAQLFLAEPTAAVPLDSADSTHSGVKRTKDESFHDIITSGPVSRTNMQKRGVYRAAHDNVVYPEGAFVGKNLLRLQRSKDESVLVPAREKESEIYDRWTQAISSAHDVCRRAITSGAAEGNSHLTVVLPGVVVPDGTLWRLEYEQNGSCFAPEQTDSATLFLNHSLEVDPNSHWMKLSHVHFWTITGLKLFLTKLLTPGNGWNHWFPDVVVPITGRPDDH